MKCPKCGATNAKNADFCNLCHAPFSFGPDAPDSNNNTDTIKKTEHVKQNKTKQAKPSHVSPGFGNAIKEDEKEMKSVKPSQPITNKTLSSLLDWILPAILATVIAYATIVLIPKEQISSNMALSKMLFASVLLGFVASSGGIVKLNPKLSATGWLLGFCGALISFNLLFISSFAFVKLSPAFYTRFFIGSETMLLSTMSVIAIVLFWVLEKYPVKKIGIIAGITYVIATIVSWFLVRASTNPIPLLVFLSWPTGYYLLRWNERQTLNPN